MQHNLTTNLQSPKLHWDEPRTSQETLLQKELEMASTGNNTTLPSCRLQILPHFQGMLSFTVKVPKPPVALFIQECVPLAQFPHSTWLKSDPEISWQVPGSLQQHWQVMQFESKQTIPLKWASPVKFLITYISVSNSLQKILLLYGAMVKQVLQHNSSPKIFLLHLGLDKVFPFPGTNERKHREEVQGPA